MSTSKPVCYTQRFRRVVLVLILVLGLVSLVAAGDRHQVDQNQEQLARILKQVGESVERYQNGLFSIAFTETLRRENLQKDLHTLDGKPMEYVFENVVLRESLAGSSVEFFAKAVRRLRSVDGRPASKDQPIGKEGKCGPSGPEDAYVDPLTLLLPKLQANFEFSDEGEEILSGRKTHVLGIVPRGQGGPKVVQHGDCFWASVPHKGKVWIDLESGEVTRFEWRNIETFEFHSPRAMNIGRLRFGPRRKLNHTHSEFVIHFARFDFTDPAQTLLLPSSVETLNVIEGASRPRTRVTRTFTDYRRFISDVKVIDDLPNDN